MRTTRSTSKRTGKPSGGYSSSDRNGYQRSANSHGKGQSRGGHGVPPAKAQPARRVNAAPLVRIGTALFLIALAAIVIFGITKNINTNALFSNTFTSGVKIDGADVSGKDVDETRSRLKEQYQSKIGDISIKITYGDKLWTLTGVDLGAAENVDEVVSRAAALARTGAKEQRLAEAQKVQAEGREFSVALSLDPDKLKIKLSEIANQVSVTGRDASLSFNPAAMDFKDPEEPTKDELNKIATMFTVNDEVAGQTVDVDMMTKRIMDDLKGDYKAEQQLIVTQFVPNVTADKLKQSFHYLATFRTHISTASTQERMDNISLALSKFNGLILYPQQQLSFNDTTGPRTEANGYEMAHVINKNAYVDDWGGGVCQASTTLYNAVLLAGCEIPDRYHHSIPSDYVDLGFDAMVNYPNGDLKFKNVSDDPIYIKAWVSPRRNAYVMIFGVPLSDCAAIQQSYQGCATISTDSELIYQGSDPGWDVLEDKKGDYAGQYTAVKLPDNTQVEGFVTMKPHPDITVDAYLVYKDANGKEIGRKKMYEDVFKAVKGTVYIPVPGKTPKPSATADSGT